MYQVAFFKSTKNNKISQQTKMIIVFLCFIFTAFWTSFGFGFKVETTVIHFVNLFSWLYHRKPLTWTLDSLCGYSKLFGQTQSCWPNGGGAVEEFYSNTHHKLEPLVMLHHHFARIEFNGISLFVAEASSSAPRKTTNTQKNLKVKQYSLPLFDLEKMLFSSTKKSRGDPLKN